MPSDANGVYSLPSGYLATTGDTIQASQHNPPLEDLASAMSARLMRSGAAPMTGPLKIVDGSASSPAIQFNSSAATGIYKTPNGFGVSINGVKVAEFTSGGISRNIGELIPFTGSTAPALTVMPYGQTLSRSAYPDLWAFAQAEIANGHTFYNNGDGSTTFGIGDLRGRVPAGRDTMGGTSANRLNPAITSAIIGATGGAQTHTLTTDQLPVHSHANSLNDAGHSHGYVKPNQVLTTAGSAGGIWALSIDPSPPTSNSGTGTSGTGITMNNANAGSGYSHNNVQPTIICNYILFAGA